MTLTSSSAAGDLELGPLSPTFGPQLQVAVKGSRPTTVNVDVTISAHLVVREQAPAARLSDAAAAEVTDSSNGAGSAISVSRSDHTHAHGNRGGGSLHPAATTSVAGFLSASDKTKLDALPMTPTAVTSTTTS